MERIFNGDLLKLLRKSQKISQIEVSKEVNEPQGNLSKIEQGLIQPDENFVSKIADFFGVTPDFFYQNEGQYSPATPYHRSRYSLQIGDKDRSESKANIYRIFLKKLLESVDIQYTFQQISSEFHTPQEIARITRKNLKLPHGPIGNLTELLEDNGVFVIDFDFETDYLDGFTILGSNDILPLIFINKTFSGERIRFTLAHELGHLIMHQIVTSNKDIEAEAFAFAAEFLMPEEDIRPDLGSLDRSRLNVERLLQLKTKWKCSMNAILKRVVDLQIVTQNQSKYLWMQMSSMGYRTQEPFPLTSETPTMLQELITLYKDDLHYSYEELSKILKITTEQFFNFFGYDLRFRAK